MAAGRTVLIAEIMASDRSKAQRGMTGGRQKCTKVPMSAIRMKQQTLRMPTGKTGRMPAAKLST